MKNGEFRQLPTFDMICAKLERMETCVEAQGNVIEHLLQQVQERQFEVAFLMSIIQVTKPTSMVAGPDGKIPVERKSAAQIYAEGGRDAIVKRMQAAIQKLQDEANGEGVHAPEGASQESPDTTKDTTGPIVTFPHRTTH